MEDKCSPSPTPRGEVWKLEPIGASGMLPGPDLTRVKDCLHWRKLRCAGGQKTGPSLRYRVASTELG